MFHSDTSSCYYGKYYIFIFTLGTNNQFKLIFFVKCKNLDLGELLKIRITEYLYISLIVATRAYDKYAARSES